MSETSFSKSKVLRSSLLMTGSTFISYFTGLVATTLTARALGPSEFGHFAYFIWLSGLIMVCANNGLNVTAIRFISEFIGRKDTEGAAKIWAWLRRRYLLSIVLISACTFAGLFVTDLERWKGQWLFLSIAVLAAAIGKATYLFNSSVAKGYGIFGIEAATTNTFSVITLVGSVILFWINAGLLWFLGLFVLTSIGHMLMTVAQLSSTKLEPLNDSLPSSQLDDLTRNYRLAIAITVVAAISNKSVETYLLSVYGNSESIGFFNLAAGLTKGGTDLLCAGITTVLMPLLAFSFGEKGIESVKTITSTLLRVYVFIGLIIFGASYYLADPAVTVMYGNAYFPVIAAFQVMGAIAGLTLIEVPLLSFLSTTDHQKLRIFYAVAALCLSVVFAAALIPKYGLNGALIGHAISRLLSVAALVILIHKKFALSLALRSATGLGLCALCSFAVCSTLAHFLDFQFEGVLWAVAFILLFTTGAYVAKIASPVEIQMMKSLANKLAAKVVKRPV